MGGGGDHESFLMSCGPKECKLISVNYLTLYKRWGEGVA